MQNIPAVQSEIRGIANALADARRRGSYDDMADAMHRSIERLGRLEQGLPSREPEAFETPNLDAFGYATILGYLNVEAPLSLMNMDDPVRETILMGRRVSQFCHRNNVKVVRVEACEHVKARYAKVTHVNAYPVHVLNAVLFEGNR